MFRVDNRDSSPIRRLAEHRIQRLEVSHEDPDLACGIAWSLTRDQGVEMRD
jgi:hypothetical protein